MLLSSSRLVQSVPRALKNTPIPFLSRFKSSSASIASKSLAPPSKSPHPIFQSYRQPILLKTNVSDQKRFSSSIDPVLSDEEFNRLPLLEQTKVALNSPRPTSFVPLRKASLEDALKQGVSESPKGEASENSTKWSLRKLAWYGDRFWDQVVAEVMMVQDIEGSRIGSSSKLVDIAYL